jgi:hypothetical protein
MTEGEKACKPRLNKALSSGIGQAVGHGCYKLRGGQTVWVAWGPGHVDGICTLAYHPLQPHPLQPHSNELLKAD